MLAQTQQRTTAGNKGLTRETLSHNENGWHQETEEDGQVTARTARGLHQKTEHDMGARDRRGRFLRRALFTASG